MTYFIDNINAIKADIAKTQTIIAEAQPLADQLAAMQAAVAAITKAKGDLVVLNNKLTEVEQEKQLVEQAASKYTVQSITSTGASSAVAQHKVQLRYMAHGINGPEAVTEVSNLSSLNVEQMAALAANEHMVPPYIRCLDDDFVKALQLHARAVSRGYLSN